MHISLSVADLSRYVTEQVNSIFPDPNPLTSARLQKPLDDTLQRVEHCFRHIREKYFSDDQQARFSHLHSDQYAAFLYLLSNAAGRHGDGDLAAKAYYLNKVLHSLDVYFEVQLPAIFLFSHPVGTVLGRANYSDYLVVHQNVTVGGTPAPDMRYPTLGPCTVLYASSSVIGTATIGANSVITSGARVVNQDVPANSLVFGESPELVTRPNAKNYIQQFFHLPKAPSA